MRNFAESQIANWRRLDLRSYRNGRTRAGKSASEAARLVNVTITAQRRSADLKSVPISMDPISVKRMEKVGENNFFVYSTSIPDLYISTGSGARGGVISGASSRGRSMLISDIAGINGEYCGSESG